MERDAHARKRRRRRQVTPEVFQMEAVECGAACLLMILKYHKYFTSLEEVRAACAVSRNGCNAASIVLAAQGFGLAARGYSTDLKGLERLPWPCIIHWDFNHFVVLEGMTASGAHINDPATGHRKVKIAELDQAFTGIALSFEPGPDFRPQGKNESVALALYRMMAGERHVSAYLVLVGFALMFAGLLFPILTQVFVDNVMASHDMGLLAILLTGMAFVDLSQVALTHMKSSVLSRLKIKLTMKGDAELAARMLRLHASFFEQRFAGELAQREEALSRLYAFVSGALADTVLDLFQIVFYLLLMFCYSPGLTLLSLLGVAACAATIHLSSRALKGYAHKRTQDRNRMMGLLCSGISVFASLKAAGAENDLVALLAHHYQTSVQSTQRLAVANQVAAAIPSAISQLMNVAVLVVGSSLVMRGRITAGVLFAFCQYLGLLLQPVMGLLSMQRQIQTLKSDLTILDDIQDSAVDARFVADRAPQGLREPLRGAVEARSLTFGYDRGARPVVRDFSMRMTPGSCVAIVGASGSGKSTVGKLLSGRLEPWQGSVLFDGHDVSGLGASLLSQCVSAVAQKEAFFAASIRDNLTLWNDAIPDADIFRALADACALEMVNALPRGLDYRLKEGGTNLSGGQRQQLAIARVLLSDPSILILDEATSAMDAPRERAVMDNLRRRDCSLIIIAHRLSSVMDADVILVMDDGVVSEAGTHDRLMALGGRYAALYRSDALGQEGGAR